MGVARVNEIALTNASCTLQTSTLEITEELGLHYSNGVIKNDVSILSYGEQDTHLVLGNNAINVTTQTSRGPKRDS